MNICPDCNKSLVECPYCRRQVCGCWDCNCEVDEGNDAEMYDYNTKDKKCHHKFSIPVPGAIGMCDYCGIDEATAKKPVIVKEEENRMLNKNELTEIITESNLCNMVNWKSFEERKERVNQLVDTLIRRLRLSILEH